jgi:hypothetical protein
LLSTPVPSNQVVAIPNSHARSLPRADSYRSD